MTDFLKLIGVIIVGAVIFIGIGWLAVGNDFFLFKYFAPKYEQVRRNTFEQSKAYRQGMVQELDNMRFQYIQAKPEQKTALASVILHRAADFDENAMSPELRSFIADLRRGQ